MSIYKGTDLVAGAVVVANVGDIIDSLYPIGSIYISTSSTCPLAAIKGTWTLVSSGIVTSVDTNVPVKGNGMAMGLYNGSQTFGMCSGIAQGAGFYALGNDINAYGQSVGQSRAGQTNGNTSAGLTPDDTKSGVVGTVSRTVLSVNVFQRTA